MSSLIQQSLTLRVSRPLTRSCFCVCVSICVCLTFSGVMWRCGCVHELLCMRVPQVPCDSVDVCMCLTSQVSCSGVEASNSYAHRAPVRVRVSCVRSARVCLRVVASQVSCGGVDASTSYAHRQWAVTTLVIDDFMSSRFEMLPTCSTGIVRLEWVKRRMRIDVSSNQVGVRANKHMHARMHTWTHARMHKDTENICMRARTHTHTHTLSHTHTHTPVETAE